MPDATLSSYQAYNYCRPVGLIRHCAASGNQCLMRRCRVLSGLQLLPTCRPDKALKPSGNQCLMRRCRVLSGLQLLPTCRPDKALVPHLAINAGAMSRLIRPATLRRSVGRIRRSRRIRQCLPAATQNFFHKPARSPAIRYLLAYRVGNTFPRPPATATISLFQQCQTRRVIACRFQLAQLSAVGSSNARSRAFHIACTNDPRGNAVDRGIEEVKADMHPVKQIVTHNLTSNCLVSSSSSTT